VNALVRPGADTRALDDLAVTVVRGGFASPADDAALVAAMAGCDLVFHAAMHFSYERRRHAELEAAAVAGTARVLRAARAAGVGRVVLTSSAVVVGYSERPEARDETASPGVQAEAPGYVGAKIRQEALAFALGRELGLEVVAACPALTIGPHGTTLGPSNGALLAYLADPTRSTFPGGCNVVSTADVAAGHWCVARHGRPGERYLLGGENLSWAALHGLVAELAGVAPPRVVLNHGLAHVAAGVEEWRARRAGRPPLATLEAAEMVGRWYWVTHARAAALGYTPRPARRAVAEALAWLVASAHVSRELRAGLRLHDDVHAVRHSREALA
jgi:dihydroflavonol-4-reductase